MIYGIGVDVTTVGRIREVLERTGERFAERVLTEGELVSLREASDRARWIAKRWAAKEAFAKAAGTGMRAPLGWHEVSMAHDDLGRPTLEVSDGLRAWLAERDVERWHLSLSDEGDIVCAMVVLETSGRDSGRSPASLP